MPSDFFQETFLYTDNEVPLSVFESFFGIGNEGLYLHCHDCMELMYVQKGSGTIYVDFQEYTVTAGDFILIAPGQLHSGNRAPHEQLYCQAIVFDLNELKEGKIDYIYKNFIYKFFDHQITPPTLIQKTQSFYDDLARDFFSIYDEYAQKKRSL